jgi:polyhydroxybutyrate depolymerase
MSSRSWVSCSSVWRGALVVAVVAGCSTNLEQPRADAVNDIVVRESNEADTDLNPALIEQRPYGSAVPSAYDGSSELPLILALHGRGSTGPQFVQGFGLLAGVDQQNVLLAYPTGQSILGASGWGAMSGVPGAPDDVTYLRAVIADMASRYRVDRTRVVVIGLSFGAFMANYFACHASDKITGIVSLAGSLPIAEEGGCVLARPISVSLVHGTDDPYVLYAGGPLPLTGVEGKHPSAPDLFTFWGNANGNGKAAELPARDLDATIDGAESTGMRRSASSGNRSVTLWTVRGGGHVVRMTAETTWSVLNEVLGRQSR